MIDKVVAASDGDGGGGGPLADMASRASPSAASSEGTSSVDCEAAASRLAQKAIDATGTRSLRPVHWAALVAGCALVPLLIYAAVCALHAAVASGGGDHSSGLISVSVTKKSPSDVNSYLGLRLPNGMRVLLSSNSDASMGVSMVCLLVGSMSDPEQLQGLAHFTEHMLFMGSQNYPEEGALKKYVYAHGGTYNGFTKDDSTCYYLTVESDYLMGGLDILSDMMHSPLIRENSSDREVLAVDSEYKRGIKSDHWRNLQLDKVTSDPSHDYHKFSVGNQQTLTEGAIRINSTLAAEARKFFEKYYSAGIMHLGIYGRQSLDVLKQAAITKFSKIVDRGTPAASWDAHPFRNSSQKLIKRASQAALTHSLSLSFALHDVTKTLVPIKQLHDHKGKGGLHRALINSGHIRTSGTQTKCIRKFCVFYMWFELTDMGFDHWKDVVSRYFAYVDFIRRTPFPDHFLVDLADIFELDYRFSTTFPVMVQVQLMERYNLSDIASAPFLLGDYKLKWVPEILEKLEPKNMRILLTSPRFNGVTDRVEPLYSTPFSIEAIAEEDVRRWKNSADERSEFSYPEKNQWIPKDLSIREVDKHWRPVPALLVDEDHYRLWYFQDTSFNTPRSKVELYFRTTAIREDKNRMGLALFEDCFKRSIEETIYAPAVVGLSTSFHTDVNGFRLSVLGFNDHVPELTQLMLDKLKSFNLTEECFVTSKKAWIKSLKLSERTSSSLHSFIRGRLLYKGLSRRWREREEAMKNCTYEMAIAHLDRVRSSFVADVYMYGNVQQSDAYRVLNSTKELVTNSDDLRLDDLRALGEHSLSRGTVYRFREHFGEQSLNSVHVYFEVGERRQMRDLVLTELFVETISAETSSVLRGQQQLGYSVGVQHERRSRMHGVTVYVESGYNTSLVEDRIQSFMTTHVAKFLQNMTEEGFKENLNALITRKRIKPKNVYDSGDRFSGEIIDGGLLFNRTELEAVTAAVFSKEDLIALHRKHIMNPASARVLITLIGSGAERDNDGVVEATNQVTGKTITYATIEDYKQSLRLLDW